MHLLRRKIQVSRPDILHRIELELLEPDDLMCNVDFTVIVLGRNFRRFQYSDLCVGDRIGKVIRIYLLYIRATSRNIQLVNVLLLSLM